MVITDVSCDKVILDVDGEYGDFDDFSEFVRGFEGVLKKKNGEAGIRTLETLRSTRFPSARTRPGYATSPNFESLSPEGAKDL